MKNLAIVGRFTLTLFAALMTANLWGQAALDGEGTADSPYLIASVDDWNKFATAVNGGYSYNGEYLKLTADITLTINNQSTTDIMVGTVTKSGSNAVEDKFFSGTFDGDWHTITFKVGNKNTPYTPATTVSPSAPFCVIDGATINNLKVTDTIFAGNKYNSGLVGFAWKTQGRDNYINNCTSSIVIDCSGITPDSNPDCSSAGLVAENKTSGSKLYFENCIFDGKIDKGTHTTAWKCAGFLSYNNGSTVYYSHCTMAGTINLTSETATFHRKKNTSFSNAYYITNYMNSAESVSPQGVKAATVEPTDDVAKKYTARDTVFYVSGSVITGFETTTLYYNNSPIEIPVTVSYYGRTLTRGTDYVIKINNEILASGTPTLNGGGVYAFAIVGMGDYAGEYRDTIRVTSIDTWAKLQDLLYDNSHNRVIPLIADVQPALPTDTVLIVRGNVVLNTNGHTIDRNLSEYRFRGQVIRVESGANLTINGGVITGGRSRALNTTAEGAYNDGGGIYNVGSLTLNNVDVIGNRCIRLNEADSTSRTARGGGIYCGSGSGTSFLMIGGSVESNKAEGGGGGVFCNGTSNFTMKNVSIWDNESLSKGGGLRIKTSGNGATLDTCDIVLNRVVGDVSDGGGVYMEAGSLTMNKCEISGNASRYRGCGFFSQNGTTTATNCEITWNGSAGEFETANLGGGICLYDNASSNHSVFIMHGGSVANNQSAANGGGIYLYDGAVLQVDGNIQITDNLHVVFKEHETQTLENNNTYLTGSAVIEVIGPLGDDAIINITPDPGHEGIYVTFDEGAASGDDAEDLSHFVIDNNDDGGEDYNSMIDGDGNVVVYEPYEWDDTDTWNGTIATDLSGNVPTASNDITIKRAIKITNGCEANAQNISFGTYGSIIIEEGGQLKNSNSVAVKAKKGVVKADAGEKSGWHVISSPVDSPDIENGTNLITELFYNDTYDLYRFNEAAALPWENYRQSGHTNFDILENGRGYLYRNANNHTIDIDGTLNVSDVTYNLSCSGSGDFKGLNLIGNPYAQNITILNTTLVDNSGNQIKDGEGDPINITGFYRLSKKDGSWGTEIASSDSIIAPLEGILVQVDEARKVKFSRTARAAAKSNGDNIRFTVANEKYEDRTFALFEKGMGLEKIEHMNEDVPMVYISSNGADYAIATFGDEVKQFNLNFEAKTTGMYTLGMKTQGEFSYLHLIDKVAEKDIDLLKEGEYEFIGSSFDKADRFVVRLAYLPDYSDDGDDNFVYQNGSDVLVSGQGELQVFDVMGRLVMQKKVNGVESVDGLVTGVYVMRIVGESVKTKKIVVR